jgi:predicted nucleotidyltransferase
MSHDEELDNLKKCLVRQRKEGKLLLAVLYGSFAGGTPHARSDIDLAIYLNGKNMEEEIELIDEILMSVDRQVSILRVDDEDESPFVVQEALKGIHLVEPDEEILYGVYHRALHESEGVRGSREAFLGSD